MTNLLASIIVTLTTNVFQPTQYLSTYIGATYPVTIVETWQDTPASGVYFNGGFNNISSAPRTRLNPDVRITEVRLIRELRFSFEGRDYVELLSNEIVSGKKETRTVTTQEEWK